MIVNNQVSVWDFIADERAIWAINPVGEFEGVSDSTIDISTF